MGILSDQIEGQLEGRIQVDIIFPDESINSLFLYSQDGKYWVSNFGNAKVADVEIINSIVEQFTDEQVFNTDPEIIRTKLTQKEFFDKYYDSLKSTRGGSRKGAGRPMPCNYL